MPANPGIFISYRRDDSAADAGRLLDALRRHFGDRSAFLDSTSVGWGDEWSSDIEASLDAATAMVVVIGPDWIRESDEWGQRRIDQPEDWVRREIAYALEAGKRILPLLVRGATMPPSDRLPPSVAALPARQAYEIRTTYWDHDIKLLISQLEDTPHDDGGHHAAGLYPTPPPERPDPVSDEMLGKALGGSLPRWRRVVTEDVDAEDGAGVELYREFRFKTFLDAVSFMNQVAPGCEIAMHHPHWENIWRTVRVHLTTWDIGHRISDRDIQLAKYFDRAFKEFPGAEFPGSG